LRGVPISIGAPMFAMLVRLLALGIDADPQLDVEACRLGEAPNATEKHDEDAVFIEVVVCVPGTNSGMRRHA